ncbi:hypothetical protein CP02DC22_1200B, partial [Chlamydia psittaci 02DC22]
TTVVFLRFPPLTYDFLNKSLCTKTQFPDFIQLNVVLNEGHLNLNKYLAAKCKSSTVHIVLL